ncbi:uncharacterized protein K452DRAFT_68271 [Aplosporella prunicola CBS 121167]|uniref:Uncharacterized protein n=1 Tax=Aplosporella prunicola CBS 121167 TaxID=1176127 RepID=A0A6A6BR73_9PEZI|nr:uncharacterized protein K452DRAFT_68271 [Aplosporella prunicola CBS 121167]KAF2146612.1 hypothetical protein K452DRAFT_68271 [Aplosporella prunicola CBS 121167]
MEKRQIGTFPTPIPFILCRFCRFFTFVITSLWFPSFCRIDGRLVYFAELSHKAISVFFTFFPCFPNATRKTCLQGGHLYYISLMNRGARGSDIIYYLRLVVLLSLTMQPL